MESKVINDLFDINVLPFNFAEEVDDIGRFSFSKVFKSIERGIDIINRLLFFRPNLVYFNVSLYGFALYRDAIYVLIFKIFRSRLLFHLRTQGVKQQVERSKMKKWLFMFMFKGTHVVSLSQFLGGDIEDVYSKKPIIVNNGILDVSQQYKKSEFEKDQAPQILFLAHLWKFKGLPELFEAFQMLKVRNVDFNAVVAGPDGDLTRDSLESLANELGLKNEVAVVGPKFADEKNQLFRDSDIFVLPTRFEGFPGAILEAMQFELPVVATIEGAIPEIVDDGVTGFLVRKENALEIADRLEQLLRDESLRLKLGKAGRVKFKDKYDLSLFEVNMANVFTQLLKTK
ncbi:MAG TPA: glycosyltransferase family 4 protein [Cyclobacteriaceae bacterium]|nr:glycosyltransferase family 4 protein [Cyclobacteriaceae bacterium]